MAILISAAVWCTFDKEAEKSTVIVVHDSDNLKETTAVTPEYTTSLTTAETVVSVSKKTKLSTEKTEKSVVSSTSVIVVVTDEMQSDSEEFLYLDINSAGFDDLIKLNGIGEYLAGQIIAYREENGGFNNIEELINVYGIGEKIFSSVRDYIYVENPVYYNEMETFEETEEATEAPVETETTDFVLTLEDVMPINLNDADVETLVLLPYVDEETAGKIIELREKLGVFTSTYEILYIDDLTSEQWGEVLEYLYI